MRRWQRVSRRNNPETFGLSTLDTVTCALGGSIILMLLLTEMTPKEAAVNMNEHRIILQSGSDGGDPQPAVVREENKSGGTSATSLLVLIVDYSEEPSGTFEVTGCPSPSRITQMRGPKENFLDAEMPPPPRNWTRAIAIWRDEEAIQECRNYKVTLPTQSTQAACRMTLVSGAHYQYRNSASCKEVNLASNEGEVFFFVREPL